ncbi:MAG: hypothetical protein CL902_02400 [Dehalococcoidia bacterium]|nr:hypothetical protein [Dehalococcoidia bacterium]
MLEVLVQTADADVGSLRAIDQSGTRLQLLASHIPESKTQIPALGTELPVSFANCPMSQALRDKSVLVIGDSTKLDEPIPSYYSPLSRSLLVCPVIVGENVLGILGFGSDMPNKFPAEIVQLMTTITSTIGVLMENSRLQQEQTAGNEKMVRLAKALEFTDEAIVLADSLGNYEYVNKSAKGVADGPTMDRSKSHNPVNPVPVRNSGQVLEAKWSREVRRLEQNGQLVDFSISTNYVTDSNNRPIGRITVGRDVTENLHMQENLLRLNQEREVEASIGRIVSSPLDMTDVFERFSTELNKIIPFDRISIASADLDHRQYTIEFVYGVLKGLSNQQGPIPFEGSITSHLVSSDTSLVFDSDTSHFREADISKAKPFPDAAFTSFMGVPLRFADEIIGTVVAVRADSKFTPEDQSLAELIGNLLSGSLANYILNQQRTKALIDADESATRFPRSQTTSLVGSGYQTYNHSMFFTSAQT